jgi:glycosyltransferase involved in cell wall biosynthesis
LRVLFVNHTGAVSGAELSLLRLLAGLGAEHTTAVACPPAGPLAGRLQDAGVPRLPMPAFEASLRLHPVQTPIGMAGLIRSGVALARLTRNFGAELIHANTPRAGLIGAIAAAGTGPPMVVRAHEHIPLTWVGRSVRSVLIHSAAALVAVSRDAARRLNQGLDQPVATVVHNSVDHGRFDPARVAPAPIREELGIDDGAALLGQVAQITPWKGQDTAIRALAELRRDGLDAHLLLVGDIAFGGKSVRYDNRAYLHALQQLLQDLDVREAVHFLGWREDVAALLAALDLSLLPSWNEPFGMVTVESMAMGTPPLVTEVGGGPELVEDRVSGRLLAPRRPEPWVRAAGELLRDREALARMGGKARIRAARFRDEVQAREMLAIYERVMAHNPRRRGVRVRS